MKNTFKIIGIIAFCAVIGFSFLTCGDGGDGGGGGSTNDPNKPAPPAPPTGHQHDWSDWYVGLAAGVETDGYLIRVCKQPNGPNDRPQLFPLFATGTEDLYTTGGVAKYPNPIPPLSSLASETKIIIPARVMIGSINYGKVDTPINYGWVTNIGPANDTGGGAFVDTNSIIEYVSIPSTITRIGVDAFKAQINLKTVEFKENGEIVDSGVTNIEKDAFSGCEALEGSLYFKRGLINIGATAFFNCKLLEEIFLPSTLYTAANGKINAKAFEGCTSLHLFINGFSGVPGGFLGKIAEADKKWGKAWREGFIDDADLAIVAGDTRCQPEIDKKIVWLQD